jgi:putative membrane protein
MSEITATTTTTPERIEAPWSRVDPRTIVVKPFNEALAALIPIVLGLFAAGQRDHHNYYWSFGIVGLLLLRGLLHWATTRYRITDEQIEVRTGLLFRQRMATRRDRLRTVEATAKLGHRLFGVTGVRIGTGQHEKKRHRGLVLDAVTSAEAERLRRVLLRRQPGPTTQPTHAGLLPARPPHAELAHAGLTQAGPTHAPAAPAGPIHAPVPQPGRTSEEAPEQAEEIARLDPKWLAYAPLTLSGIAAIGVLMGLVWRSMGELNINSAGVVRAVLRWVAHTPTGMVVLSGVLATLLVVVLGSMLVYLFQFYGYRLTSEPDATLHVRRGLLTTSAMTIEEARLRGVELREPLLLRIARGARCDAVATGLRQRNESHILMPPGPVREANRVVSRVLHTADSPTAATLRRHPRQALHRRLTRALLPTAAFVLLLWLGTLPAVLPNWCWQVALVLLPIAAVVGHNRFRNLGHTLTGEYLVTRFGSLQRRTVALQRSGIIGWKVRQSCFQRRAGLVTVAATTAAGRGEYHALDLAEADGLAFIEEVTPGMLAPFVERG